MRQVKLSSLIFLNQLGDGVHQLPHLRRVRFFLGSEELTHPPKTEPQAFRQSHDTA
jgi:hypothetical protein